MIGLEDTGGPNSDFDFNDMVISMQPAQSTQPVPFSVTAYTGGSVTVQSSAINGNVPITVAEGNTQSWSVAVGTTVELTANSNSGYSFGSWTPTNGITGIENPESSVISVTVPSPSNMIANFIATSALTIIDFNHDGTVNFADMIYFLDAYIQYSQSGTLNPACDLNHDGVMNSQDMTLFLTDYNAALVSIYGTPLN